MNKRKGNMYEFIDYTWNPVKGVCIHKCKYCYMHKIPKPAQPQFFEKVLNENLGYKNIIFVGSAIDLFARNIPEEWIRRVIRKIIDSDNIFILQTKNPKRYFEFMDILEKIRDKVILATTIESDIDYKISEAPTPEERYKSMKELNLFRKMVTIEPIFEFNLKRFLSWLREISPDVVTIGAYVGNEKFIEPRKEKILELIKNLEEFTNVYLKHNLGRILGKIENNCSYFKRWKYDRYASSCTTDERQVTFKEILFR